MKVIVDIYAIEAAGVVELDVDRVEDAKTKALEMAKAHSVPLKPPEEKIIATVRKAVTKHQ